MKDQWWRAQAEPHFEKAWLVTQRESSQAFRALEQRLHACRKRLQEPLWVAIAGESNIGKSTFINALLGENLLAMGPEETTYIVTVIRAVERDSDQRSLWVHYQQDGEEKLREEPFERLAHYTRRAPQSGQAAEEEILFVEVRAPIAILDDITILDTPGLRSHYREDSETTLSLLSQHTPVPGDLFKRVDALLYVIGRDGMKDRDCTALQRFLQHSASQLCPLNVLGVATYVDKRWPEKRDPLQAGKESVINTLAAFEQRLSHLFYTMEPVSGLLALGSQTLCDSEFEALCRLADMPLVELKDLLKVARTFIKEEDARLPAPELRRQLLNHLGEYGVYSACEQISAWRSEQVTPEKAALVRHLFKLSGMPVIDEYLLSHFIRYSFLLQLEQAAQELLNWCHAMQRALAEQERASLAALHECFESMQKAFAPFWRGLEVLGQYQQKRLRIGVDAVQELRHLTGQQGLSFSARLGLPPRKVDLASVQEMRERASERFQYWNAQRADARSANEYQATSVFCDIYRDIHHKLSLAHEHLQEAQRLAAEAEAHLRAAKAYLVPDDEETNLAASSQ